MSARHVRTTLHVTRSNHRNRHSNQGGFTIFELMTAMIVTIILATLALPMIAAFFIDDQLKTGTENTLGIVQFAQVQAAMRGRAYGLFAVPSNSSHQGTLTLMEGTSNSCSSTTDENATLISSIDFKKTFPEVYLSAVTPTSANLISDGICFKPNGRVVRGDNGAPVPSSNPELGAGTVSITLQHVVTLGSGNKVISHPTHQIKIEQNGDVSVDY